jgi:hypothetical protein
MKKYLFLVCLIIIALTPVFADDAIMSGVQSVTDTATELARFIGNGLDVYLGYDPFSFQGFMIGGAVPIAGPYKIGAALGFGFFDYETPKSSTIGETTITIGLDVAQFVWDMPLYDPFSLRFGLGIPVLFVLGTNFHLVASPHALIGIGFSIGFAEFFLDFEPGYNIGYLVGDIPGSFSLPILIGCKFYPE